MALKVIKPGMDTEQVVARFEAERQALAIMDHPSIAKVFDAGVTDSGRPYFVMELVKGVPITEYCDAVHLTTKERLELFIPVCQAIQHAHQKGIIHRDIKPSNVLVAMQDGKPVPKVIDFGIAKAIDQRLTEKTFFTQHGAIIGTLEYMSPEQAEISAMDIDTRADIYALGVLLYELLTGSTPLERPRLREAGYSEILRRIREEEPPKPSTRLSESRDSLPSVAALRKTEPARLSRLMRGDLDWIVMKALEKDRTRRYESASGFARDIERHLEGDPVEAGPAQRGLSVAKAREQTPEGPDHGGLLRASADRRGRGEHRDGDPSTTGARGWRCGGSARSSGQCRHREGTGGHPRGEEIDRAGAGAVERIAQAGRGRQHVPDRGVPQPRPVRGRPHRAGRRPAGSRRREARAGIRRIAGDQGALLAALGQTYRAWGFMTRPSRRSRRPARCGRRPSAPTIPTR